MTGQSESVAIIGAGVSGLVTARTLLAEGHSCTLFERAGKLGGVWAEGYIDFGVQVQKELYEFPDWPLPEDTPDFTPGPVFQRYLEGYCDHFGIRPHLQLKSVVTALSLREDGVPGWTLTVRCDGEETQACFDRVILATGLYSETPNIPDIAELAVFAGEVLHAYQAKQRACLEGRKVVVAGYGKSATDLACEAARVAADVHLVFRRPHWLVPRKLAGLVPFKWGMLNRLTAALIPPYVHPGPVSRCLHAAGGPLPWLFWRLVALLLRVQFSLGTKISGAKPLLPDTPVEVDCFGDSTMVPRPEFIPLVKSGRIRVHRTWIDHFEERGLVLKDGTTIAADQVIFATGWKSRFDFLPSAVQEKLADEGDGFYLYRHILHPAVPRLAFIGRAASFLSCATFALQARWLAEVIAGRNTLPSTAEMQREIDAIKAWKRRWMPSSSGRSARVLLHMAHYHDELLRDIGADPYRKRGIFAPLKELLAPYQSSDYREIADGSWRQTPSDQKPAFRASIEDSTPARE